jgi:type I restriction enzyme R subunit
MGTDGKLITESLTDYTRKNILGEYATLDEFLQKWSSAKQKYYILDEMAAKGIPIYELADRFGEDVDMFDIVTSIAYGQKPQGRKSRAEKVRHSRFLSEYQGKAREVLEALVDKYESTSLKSIEKREVLKVQPLHTYGTPMEIANLFGGIDGYERAVESLTAKLYETAA